MIQQQLLAPEHIEVDDSSDSYCTPRWLVKLVHEVLVWVDTDPCSNGFSVVGADEAFTIKDDGLSKDWGRRVFCNLPYSDPMPWMERCSEHRGVALVLPKMDPGTRWWQKHARKAEAMCLLEKRVAFSKNGVPQNGADFSSVMLLMGDDSAAYKRAFCDAFKAHGDVWTR